MKLFLHTLIGTAFAASLVFATSSQTPEELVQRFYISADQEDSDAIRRDLNPKNWQVRHPQAEIRITVKYGFPYKDDNNTIRVADWDSLPYLWDDQEGTAELDNYVEQSHGPRSQNVKPSGSGFSITTA